MNAGARARLPDCDRHPDKPGVRTCETCSGRYCEFCTARRQATGLAHVCPACWVRGRLVETRPAGSASALAGELSGAFSYPLAGGGWVALVAGAVLGGVLSWFIAVGGFFMLFFALAFFLAMVGYVWVWLLRIVSATADGEDSLPDWPDFSGLGGMVVQAAVLFLLLALCGIPIALTWLAGAQSMPALLAALVVGLSCFPMGMLALAMSGSIRALNPLLVVPSIFKVGRGYLVAIGALVVVMLVRLVVERALDGVPLVGGLLLGVASLYFLVVQARVVGLLYRVYERDLGWFD